MSSQPARTQERAQQRSPQRNATPRFHPWRLLFGMSATAFAWFALMAAGEVLTANVCALSDAAHPQGPPSWAMPLLGAITVACFVLAVAGGFVSWRNLAFMRKKRRQPLQGRARRVAELEWFVAKIGALSNAIFMFGMIATGLAVAMLSPRGGAW
jgi:hypothetical protein